MRPTTLWARVLDVEGFVVQDVVWDAEEQAIVVSARVKFRHRHQCPHCKRRSPGYDAGGGVRRWRALDAGVVRVFIEAEAPRVRCREHGVVVAAVPWARHRASSTTSFDNQVAWLAAHTDKTTVSTLMRIAWRSVGRIIERVGTELAAKLDRFNGLKHIGVDEISYRKGHRYLTVVVDHDTGRLIWAYPGKGHEALQRFFAAVGEEGCARIELVSTDAAPWFVKILESTLKNASLCIDPFHVVAWAGLALDNTRRDMCSHLRNTGRRGLARALKGSRWALWKNPEDLSRDQRATLDKLEEANHPVFRAYLLKEQLREVFRLKGRRGVVLLEHWIDLALDSGLKDFVDVGRRIAKNLVGIVAALEHGLSNARVEAINTQIRLMTRFAFGFHSPAPLIALAMLRLGGLCPPLPGRG